MTKLVVLIVMVVFWLVACLPTPKETFPKVSNLSPTPSTLYLDHSFTGQETKDLIKGIQHLECSTNYYFRFQIFTGVVLTELPVDRMDETAILIRRVDDKEPSIVASDGVITKGYLTYGLYIPYVNWPREILMVATRLKQEDYAPVMTHELLHSQGLHHSKSKSIMSAAINDSSSVLTETDFNQICSIYDCDPKTFKTCH